MIPRFYDTKIGMKVFNSMIEHKIDSDTMTNIENDLSKTLINKTKKYESHEKQMALKYFTEMEDCLEESGCPLSYNDIAVFHASYVSFCALTINDDPNINLKDKSIKNKQFLQEIYDIGRTLATHKNIDFDCVLDTYNQMFPIECYESTYNSTEQFLSNVTANEQENVLDTSNINKEFLNSLNNKSKQGMCKAKFINSSEVCNNKVEPGNICCEEHRPLTQEEKRIKYENGSMSTFSSECNNSNDHNHDHNKCRYVKTNGQCKKPSTVGGFCNDCHNLYTKECEKLQSNDYCTVILTKGRSFNKNRACGNKSCGKGMGVCSDHCPKIKEVKCCHIKNDGQICDKVVKNPFHTKCGMHINSINIGDNTSNTSNIEREKTEDELEWEKQKQQPTIYCEIKCKSGKMCRNKALCYAGMGDKKETEKAVCGIHYNIHMESLTKTTYHRCAATTLKGKQCLNCSVAEGFLYCNVHEQYDPEERCGAFDEKIFNRCPNKCVGDGDFCGRHVKCKDAPLKTQEDVALAQEKILKQRALELQSKPKPKSNKPLKLMILNDKSSKTSKTSKISESPKTPEAPKLINEEAYGLDCHVSNSEDSDGTEESEIETSKVEQQVEKPKRTLNLPVDEFESINKITGWTEEEILKMRNKRVFKRILGPKKKLDVEKSIADSKIKLEKHFTKAINQANSNYNKCKIYLSNIIRATFFDLSDSITNVIGLFGAQRFSSRENLLPDCKESIKTLRNIESVYTNKTQGLPIPVTKKQLVPMNIKKYISAFEDVIHTVNKERKEDVKYIKEFQKFMNYIPKNANTNPNYEAEREKKREMYNQKYKNYFEKYIVRFAKVSLHSDNSKGRMFGFANYFIDLLHQSPLDYTRFKNAYGGEFKYEDGKKVFYCDVFSVISKILKNNLDSDLLDYIDVDISLNLSASEHQTEFSQSLREVKLTGKTKAGCKSMLDEGIIERFEAKDGCYEYDNNWGNNKDYVDEIVKHIPGYYGNALQMIAKQNNYVDYNLVPDQPNKADYFNPLVFSGGRMSLVQENPNKTRLSVANNVEDILAELKEYEKI